MPTASVSNPLNIEVIRVPYPLTSATPKQSSQSVAIQPRVGIQLGGYSQDGAVLKSPRQVERGSLLLDCPWRVSGGLVDNLPYRISHLEIGTASGLACSDDPSPPGNGARDAANERSLSIVNRPLRNIDLCHAAPMLPGLLASLILSRKVLSVELRRPSMLRIWYSLCNVDSSKLMKLYRGLRYSQMSLSAAI